MRALSIAGKIWLSVGVFAGGTLVSLSVSQVNSVRAEARLRLTNDALFPAAQSGQQAEAAFERMAKGFLDALLLEEQAPLDQAKQDGAAAAEALQTAASLPNLDPSRAKSLAALASEVSALARDAHAAYAPMLALGGNLTPEMGATAQWLAGQTDVAKQSVRAASAELAADLRNELAQAVRASAWQRWISLIAFFTSLGVSSVVVAFTIRRAIVRPIRVAITGLTETAGQVASTSGHVAAASQSLSRGASAQAASLEETSASMEEMSAMTRKNAENSQQAATVMNEVDAHVRESNAALGAMVGSMAAIQASSQSVSKIIKTIDDIAFQTNILALNAAVEAARAGVAGAGFAVVADEVRNLAHRSAEAAKDTAELIEESIGNAQSGAIRVEQVTASINNITESVGRVKALVEEVSQASHQQALGLHQVAETVAQMKHVTETTAATTEDTAAAGEMLTAHAGTAMGAVRQLEVLLAGTHAATVAEPLQSTRLVSSEAKTASGQMKKRLAA